FNAIVLDHIKRIEILLILAGFTAPFIALLGYLTGTLGAFNPAFTEAWIIAVFVCLAFFIGCWVIFLNKTVVERFRGRITGLFIFLSLGFVVLYSFLYIDYFNLGYLSNTLPEIIAIISIVAVLPFKTWKWKKYPLAVHGNHIKYFRPMVLLLASHMLWFFGTKVTLLELHPSFVSISQEFQIDIGFGFGIYEPLLLGLGALIGGLYADFRGRKTGFNMAILLMGLLAIFSPIFYDPVAIWGIPLLLMERLIEGYIIGICCLLIWNEIGSAKTKARRLSLVWFFFLGYALLFWALDHTFMGLNVVTAFQGGIGRVGGPFAILIALITQYISTDTPKILGREVEMEELALDFDDKEVRATVEAFVGEDDFSSIQSQLEILDVTQELSDSEFGEIVGEDFQNALPLRRIPGIGPKLEEKLVDAGYTSAAQLAGETASRLSSKVEGLSQDRAERILADARKVVKKTIKEKQNPR
ncbi:MAG: helix-hairpin-helix domain-containing protein, partial [Candidatus Thorarchaeota archaeon]